VNRFANFSEGSSKSAKRKKNQAEKRGGVKLKRKGKMFGIVGQTTYEKVPNDEQARKGSQLLKNSERGGSDGE